MVFTKPGFDFPQPNPAIIPANTLVLLSGNTYILALEQAPDFDTKRL